MRASINKMWPAGAVAACFALAVSDRRLGSHARHVPAELGGRRGERGLRRGSGAGLLQGRRARRHARAGQRLGQHGAARRQRPRAARVRRRGRDHPADREGRADEGRVDDLSVEPQRGFGAQEDRHQVDQGPRRQEGRRAVRLVADDDAAALPQGQQPEGIGHEADRTCRRRRWCPHCCRDRWTPSSARSTRTRSSSRRRARSSTSTASPTTACRPSARRSSPATPSSRRIRTW